MRKLGMIVALGVAGLAVACGGSSSTSGDSGAGGTAGGGGTGGTGGGGALGSCNAPSCMTGLLSSCTPTGTCVAQSDLTTLSSNTCYSNGVKQIVSTSTTGTMTMTLKNGSSICYSMDIALTAQPSTVTFKNASGSVVATGTYDSTTQATTVTCTGGQAITLNSSCQSIASAIGGGSTCTDGACTP